MKEKEFREQLRRERLIRSGGTSTTSRVPQDSPHEPQISRYDRENSLTVPWNKQLVVAQRADSWTVGRTTKEESYGNVGTIKERRRGAAN